MLYQINGLNPGLLRNLRDEPHAWARGENLDAGRKVLHHWVKISSF